MLCSRGLGGVCGSNRCVVVKQCDIEDVMKCIVPLESVGVWCIQEMNRSVVIGVCVVHTGATYGVALTRECVWCKQV